MRRWRMPIFRPPVIPISAMPSCRESCFTPESQCEVMPLRREYSSSFFARGVLKSSAICMRLPCGTVVSRGFVPEGSVLGGSVCGGFDLGGYGSTKPSLASLSCEPLPLSLVSDRLTVSDIVALPETRDSLPSATVRGSAKSAISSMCVARCVCSSESGRSLPQTMQQESCVVLLAGRLDKSRMTENWYGVGWPRRVLRLRHSLSDSKVAFYDRLRRWAGNCWLAVSWIVRMY